MQKIDRTGEKHITNEGYWVEIIECINSMNCAVQFDNNFVIKETNYARIKSGKIKNPYHKSVLGVGYLGVGNYRGTKNVKIYDVWYSMLERCYNKKWQEKNLTYKDVKVCKKWHNYQNFASWYEENHVENFHLDKDILFKGNKIYSPQTCCFVPQEINNLLVSSEKVRGKYPIGVRLLRNKFQARLNKLNRVEYLGTFDTPEEAFQAYKTAKEAYIKEVANEWEPSITPETYQALINYKVEITD